MFCHETTRLLRLQPWVRRTLPYLFLEDSCDRKRRDAGDGNRGFLWLSVRPPSVYLSWRGSRWSLSRVLGILRLCGFELWGSCSDFRVWHRDSAPFKICVSTGDFTRCPNSPKIYSLVISYEKIQDRFNGLTCKPFVVFAKLYNLLRTHYIGIFVPYFYVYVIIWWVHFVIHSYLDNTFFLFTNLIITNKDSRRNTSYKKWNIKKKKRFTVTLTILLYVHSRRSLCPRLPILDLVQRGGG